MARRITIIDGHPEPGSKRFCHALSNAYAVAAIAAGHDVQRVKLCDLDFLDLSRGEDWETEAAPEAIVGVQGDIAWAQHLVIIYPLWLESMPARLKALVEQTFRPGFAFGHGERTIGVGQREGRTVRVIVTMGMPAVIYRAFYFAHSLKALKRNILTFVGIGPTRSILIGNVESLDEAQCQRWLERVGTCGKCGD